MRTVTDVVCPFCGTLCDDLEVDIDDAEKICETRNACIIGDNKFMTAQAPDRHLHPRRRHDGQYISVLSRAVGFGDTNGRHPKLHSR